MERKKPLDAQDDFGKWRIDRYTGLTNAARGENGAYDQNIVNLKTLSSKIDTHEGSMAKRPENELAWDYKKAMNNAEKVKDNEFDTGGLSKLSQIGDHSIVAPNEEDRKAFAIQQSWTNNIKMQRENVEEADKYLSIKDPNNRQMPLMAKNKSSSSANPWL